MLPNDKNSDRNNRKPKPDFDKKDLLHFDRTPKGEKVLRLTDRRRGERLTGEFTFEEIKQAFDEA